MSVVDPNARINLQWKPAFGPILQELDRQLKPARTFRKSIRFVARAILQLLKDGANPLTAKDVIDSIYQMDAPPNGWLGFDRNKWYAHVPHVVTALQSSKPERVLSL